MRGRMRYSSLYAVHLKGKRPEVAHMHFSPNAYIMLLYVYSDYDLAFNNVGS